MNEVLRLFAVEPVSTASVAAFAADHDLARVYKRPWTSTFVDSLWRNDARQLAFSAHALLRPLDPVWRWIFGHLAERFARAPMVLPLLVVVVAVSPEILFWPSTPALVLGLAATALAFVTRFFLQYAVAMLSFFTERASAAERLNVLVTLFLSGMFAPLELYPPAVAEFALYTPYPYLAYFPAMLFAGGDVDVTRGFCILGVWTVVAVIAQRGLWRVGIARFSSMGA